MIWRLLIVAAVVSVSWVVVRFLERRPAGRAQDLAPGLTLITGRDCGLCPAAVAATDGAGVSISIIDIDEVSDPSIRSLPIALVADRTGTVIASRSGRSAITAMPELIAMARGVA